MWIIAVSITLLVLSNVIMNYAWYGHLDLLKDKPAVIAIIFSWGIAFFEYSLMIPANRFAHEYLTIGQLKIIQEAITLSVFIPMSLLCFGEKWNWDYAWSALCLMGAVFFAFRSKIFE
ncbi:MAG: DMT family protein [Succinivibrionaceae bacterium]